MVTDSVSLIFVLTLLFPYFGLLPLFSCKCFAQLFEMLLIYKAEYNDIIYYTLEEEKINMQCKSDISNLFLDILFVRLNSFYSKNFQSECDSMHTCRRAECISNWFEKLMFESPKVERNSDRKRTRVRRENPFRTYCHLQLNWNNRIIYRFDHFLSTFFDSLEGSSTIPACSLYLYFLYCKIAKATSNA